MKSLDINIRGDTGFDEDRLHHTDVDCLHFYVEAIIGHREWGKARDAMAGVMDANGDLPQFGKALKAYFDILHEWEYLMLSTPMALLSAAAAWIWVANSKRHPQ